MALEDITAGHTVANLVTSNPDGADAKSQGDDHIRNIKKAVQQTFMNLSATVSSVAAELDFAHKGGTVSGAAVVKGAMSISGAVNITSTLSVSGATVTKDLAADTLSASVIKLHGVQAYQLMQHFHSSIASAVSITATTTQSFGPPAVTSGQQLFSVIIKPTKTDSIIKMNLQFYAANSVVFHIHRGAGNAVAIAEQQIGDLYNQPGQLFYEETASVTSTITYQVRAGITNGFARTFELINQLTTSATYSGAKRTTFILEELAK